MATHSNKRPLSLYTEEGYSNKRQITLPDVNASVHDHSQGTMITVTGNNNNFHYGSNLTYGAYNILDDVIQNMKRSHNAEYDIKIANAARGPCTPDTRTAVLQKLLDWCNSDTILLYWLSGMAGTGKTTIAYTICQKLAEAGRLGASFFCSRSLPDCRDSTLIIPSIAFQLARKFPSFSEALAGILRHDEYILKRHLDVQLRKLIIEPWTVKKDQLPDNTIVVVDALDECDEDHSEFLQVVCDYIHQLPFKFLMTSRPETSVRDIIIKKARVPGTLESFVLHEVKSDLVRDDIAKYLRSQLSTHVTPDDIQFLTDLAGTLFIFAATLVRFLTAKSVSTTTRIKLLRTSLPSNTRLRMLALLDELYKGVLRVAFHADLLELEVQQMRQILWTVLFAREPLTRKAIGDLWTLPEGEVEERLNALRSIISVPDDVHQPITVFHGSFQDFMEDPTRSGQFCCHPHTSNLEILKQCLALMKHELRQNICQLDGRPPNNSVDPDIIHHRISFGLQYACIYWVEHLMLSDRSERRVVLSLICNFLITNVLQWFECLSLTWRLPVGVQSLERLLDALDEDPDLTDLAYDRLRFLQHAYDSIQYSAMETYYSALTWIPLHSPLRTHYTSQCDYVPSAACGLPTTWTGPDQTINISPSGIWTLAISRDGRLIISGCMDGTVHIWNTVSQIEESVFESRPGDFVQVAISGDGRRGVSTSDSISLQVWDVTTREVFFTLKANSKVFAVAMSADDTQIASGHKDGLIRVWSATDGHLVRSLRGRARFVQALSFTCDGTRLISATGHNTIHIWNVTTGQMERALDGHTEVVRSVACSPQSNEFITGSEDKTARLWDVSGKELHVLRGHLDEVNSVAFMPDGNRAVTGSDDRTVRVWDVASGVTVRIFAGLGHGVDSVAVFPDGIRIASSSSGTISIWNLREGPFTDGGEAMNANVSMPTIKTWSTAFSANGQKVLLLPSLSILDTVTLEERCSLGSKDAYYEHGALSISGSRAAASPWEYEIGIEQVIEVQLWELTSDGVVAKHTILQGHAYYISSLSFSHDECQLLTSSYDSTVRVWDVSTGQQICILHHGEDQPSTASFSHDDMRIFTTTHKLVRIWNTQSGMLLHQFEVKVYSPVFSPDDRYIITSYNWLISIYDTKTYELERAGGLYQYWTIMSNGSSYALSNDGWICHFPCLGDSPRRLVWVPFQYRPTINSESINGSLFTLTSRGVQVCLPRQDGLVTLVIPRDA